MKASSRGLLCVRSFFYYCFNFTSWYWSIQSFSFFLIQFGKIVCFQKFVHYIQVVQFLGLQLCRVISYNPFYFYGINCNFSLFISDFIYLGPLSFLEAFLNVTENKYCSTCLITCLNRWKKITCFCFLIMLTQIVMLGRIGSKLRHRGRETCLTH